MKRNFAVDWFKAVAIFGVLVHHVPNRRFEEVTRDTIYLWINAFSWAVYGFVFISGFLHGNSRRERPTRIFLVERARRLLIPYAVLGLVYATGMQCLHALNWIPMNTGLHATTWLGKVQTLFFLQPGLVVGNQLYFFVLLFLVAAALGPLLQSGNGWAALLTSASGLAVLAYCLRSWTVPTTGLSAGMLLVCAFQYALGFSYARLKTEERREILVLGLLLVGGLLLVMGRKSFFMVSLSPAIFLLLQRLAENCGAGAGAAYLGEASGTVFAYHNPFVLQPILLVLFHLKLPQLSVAFLAIAICMVLLTVFHWGVGRIRWLKWMRI